MFFKLLKMMIYKNEWIELNSSIYLNKNKGIKIRVGYENRLSVYTNSNTEEWEEELMLPLSWLLFYLLRSNKRKAAKKERRIEKRLKKEAFKQAIKKHYLVVIPKTDDEKKLLKIHQWLELKKYPYKPINQFYYYFEDEEHAIEFKLSWG